MRSFTEACSQRKRKYFIQSNIPVVSKHYAEKARYANHIQTLNQEKSQFSDQNVEHNQAFL